jgi:hypothetical protein
MVTLKSGASFEISMPEPNSPEGDFVIKLRKTDRIQLCYAPAQQWADAGPNARMAIIGDLDNKDYMYALSYPIPK